MKSALIIRLILLTLVIVVGACVFWLPREGPQEADQEWQPPRLVRVEGVNACFNYSWYVASLWRNGKNKHGELVLLAREGDLLLISEEEDEEGFPHLYREHDGSLLVFELDSCSLSLNGKTVSLVVAEDNGGWDFLHEAESDILAGLRLMQFGEFDSSRIEILEKVAELNPHLGLLIAGTHDMWHAMVLLDLFDPEFLFWEYDPREKEDIAALRCPTNTKYMIVDQSDNVINLEFLTGMTGLRSLMLSSSEGITGSFPKGLEYLQRLAVWTEYPQTLSGLSNLPNLHELHFISDSVKSIDSLLKLEQLNAFGLFTFEQDTLDMLILHELQQLRGLQWLGVPSNISQQQFVYLVDSHPDLVGLELLGFGLEESTRIHDLSPLMKLRHLEYLVLIDVVTDYEPLRSLTGLRYLVLPENAFDEDSLGVAELEQALSETVIVKGIGICLGSGWILTLLPTVALARFLTRRRQQTTTTY